MRTLLLACLLALPQTSAPVVALKVNAPTTTPLPGGVYVWYKAQVVFNAFGTPSCGPFRAIGNSSGLTAKDGSVVSGNSYCYQARYTVLGGVLSDPSETTVLAVQ